MDLGLQGKTAFVNGASGGIGAATVRLLASEGCDIVVSYNLSGELAANVAADVRAQGRRCWLCQMDVSRASEVERAVAELPEDLPKLDVVVLCSGDAPVKEFSDLLPEEWQQIIEVNLNGPFHVLSGLRGLLNDEASIVTVSSVAARTGVPHHAHYAAAKAGLINLTKSAARALGPRVRVNCVAPGMTLTEMGKQTAASLPADYAQQKLLLQRFAEPIEIAKCIVFLASPAASFVTGATLDVNGGRDLR